MTQEENRGPELYIDVAWLLERQAEFLPKNLEITDYSGLAAAVARHRVNTPRLGYIPDAAWRASALFHEIVSVRPLPARNPAFAALVALSYMHASGAGIDQPYGEIINLAKDVRAGRADVFDCADRIRSWRK